MMIAVGTRLGPYEIVAPVGAGGRGEVYRARDTRLGRDVAVKVLSTSLSPERRAHSIIRTSSLWTTLALTVTYVVSELLEGESLEERLGDGPLAKRKAIASYETLSTM